MDRRLIERTIEVANQSQDFGPRALGSGMDRRSLGGGGRGEDTYNLVGHALKKVMRVVADQQERDLAEVAQEAGAELVCSTSLKAVLDRDWDQQLQKDEALTLVLQVLHTVDAWVQQLTDPEDKAVADPILAIAKQVEEQDVQMSEEGKTSLVKGVAKDRRISVQDSEISHGRKL